MLLARDNECVGRFAFTLGDIFPGDPVGIEEQFLSLADRGVQHRQRSLQVVVHQVGKPPPSSFPGIGAENPFFVFEAFGAFHLFRFNVDRRGQAHRGAFEENAGDVVKPGRIVKRTDPPAGKKAARGDAFQVLLFQVITDARTDQVDGSPDQGVDARRGRVLVGGTNKRSPLLPIWCSSTRTCGNHFW